MQRHSIHSIADIEAIESRPYRDFMPHQHIIEALGDVAARHPERRALSYLPDADLDTPARSWTYRDLLVDIRRAANLFSTLVPGEVPRVAMLLPAIPEAHIALWGAETAGAVCPINYLLDGMHVAELLRACGANILVALGPNPQLDIWSKVESIARECPGLKQVLAVGGAPGHPDFETALRQMSGDTLLRQPAPGPDQLAALFHTGGTTGAPKLAQHTRGNQLHAAWGAVQMYATDERDVVLTGFPMFHVAGAFVFGLAALLSGAEIVLPTLLGLRDAAFMPRYWQFVERHRVSVLTAVPTVMATLLNITPQQSNLSSVRAMYTGGSPLPNELAAAFERQFGIPVRNILGMTECAGVVSIEPFLSPRTAGSCGLRLPFTQVQAVAPDGRVCAPGESGMLRLRGPHVGPGYTDARRDSGTFTADGWLNTGDLGHIDEQGRVFVTGRSKDLIIRSGHNIDPLIIEEALLQHPDVLMAAAVGEPDEYAGELPVAFVSLKPGASVQPAELSSFVNPRIAERPAWPKRIELLPAIPVTAVGKVYKPQLRLLATDHALRQRLADAGLQQSFELVVEDTAGTLAARFIAGDSETANQHGAGIAALMAPFAIRYTLETLPSETAA